MNDLDQKIHAALQRTASADLPGENPNLAEEVLLAFRGRQQWFTRLLVFVNLIFVAGTAWAVMHFLKAGNLSAQLQWGALAFALFQAVMFIKLWFWLEMHSNRVLREVKRLELLLVTRPPA